MPSRTISKNPIFITPVSDCYLQCAVSNKKQRDKNIGGNLSVSREEFSLNKQYGDLGSRDKISVCNKEGFRI